MFLNTSASIPTHLVTERLIETAQHAQENEKFSATTEIMYNKLGFTSETINVIEIVCVSR